MGVPAMTTIFGEDDKRHADRATGDDFPRCGKDNDTLEGGT